MSVEINVVKVTGQSGKEVAVVNVKGRIDTFSADDLNGALQNLIDEGHFNILINLFNTEYLSSAGMREMVSARRQVTRNGGEIGLNLNPRISPNGSNAMSSLELAGLIESGSPAEFHYTWYEDTNEAVEHFYQLLLKNIKPQE